MASNQAAMAAAGAESTDARSDSSFGRGVSLPGASQGRSDDIGQQHTATAELLAVFRKLSWYLLPVFFVLNMLNYLDRTNLAFASIQMSQDLELTTSQYGIGAGLFFVGYSTFQLPSQMILRVVGAPIWLSIIVTTWGITASCMAAIKDEISFYVVRSILGFAEAGSFPGHWYYLTRFYSDDHITIPFSITDSAIMIAQVVGAPIAAGLLHLDGIADLKGWQWLFIVEGMPTMMLGILLPILLPPNPRSARFLTPPEAEALDKELTACRSIERSSEPLNSAFSQLKSALMNGPMYVLGLVKFGKDFTTFGCMFWAPMLIKELLHKHQESGDGCTAWEGHKSESPETGYREVLLTAIPYSLAALSSILVAWNSQRTGERKWHISMSYTLGAMMLLALPAASNHSILAGFVVLTLVIVFSLCANGTLLALASADGEGPALSLNLAVFNSIGNISGLFGPWLLGEVVGRTCSYNIAFYIMGGFLAAAGVLVHLSPDKAGSKAAALQASKSYVELPQQQHIVRVGGNIANATRDSHISDPIPTLDEV